MEILKRIYDIANTTMTEPGNFGSFHIAFVVAIALLTVFVSCVFKNCSEKTVKGLSAFVWFVILILEIYKQLVFSISFEDGAFVWDYSWYIFPFQFCSSPLYILPIIAFTKSDKLRESCISYMMTFSLFAGLAVFCYPNDVFVETVGINFQTMIHHGSQILMGVFYGVRYRDKISLKFFFKGVKIFVVMVLIAMTLNVAVYNVFTLVGIDETFNMFYVSPYFECTLPLLNTIWAMIPYPAFLCVYFFGFILCALIVFSIFNGLTKGARESALLMNARRRAYEDDCIFYYNA